MDKSRNPLVRRQAKGMPMNVEPPAPELPQPPLQVPPGQGIPLIP